MLHPVVVRNHARAVSIAILLSAMDEAMLSLLPWTTTTWAGFPSRALLLCSLLTTLVRQVPLIVLAVLHVSCAGNEASGMETAMIVLLFVTLLQELLEKSLLALGQSRLEELP